MNKLLLACILSVFTLSSVIASAADAPKTAQSCVACHGQKGNSSNPAWPNLAGQNAAYLARQLMAFRDGQRENQAMTPFVKELSDTDISSLANYYASLTPETSANGDASLVASGENLSAYCKACHGMQGKPVAELWPNLAGQQALYLQTQLAAYKSGTRANPHMQTVVITLGDPQFAALAAYYSQLRP